MFKSGLAVLFLLASWFSAACAYELLPAHVAVVYNGKSELSRRMAREYARVRGVPEGNLVSLDCPMTGEISRKEYEETIRVPLLETARKQRWWVPSGIASSPLMNRKIFVLALMAALPMKIRHETPAPLPGKGVNQMQTDRAAVDSELALLAVGGYERKSWQVNPYFNKREDFVGSGLPSFLVCRLDGLTPDTCMRLVTEPANVEKKGLWGWAVVDRGGPYAQGDRWMDDVFERVREAGIPAYLDDWPQTLPEKFPLSRDTALYCGWYAGNANGPFSDPSFRFRPGAIAMHLHSFSAADFKVPGRGWSSALLEKLSLQALLRLFHGKTAHVDAVDVAVGIKCIQRTGIGAKARVGRQQNRQHDAGDQQRPLPTLFGFLVQPLPRLGLHLGFTDRFHKKPSCFDRYVK